ncbi:MAG: glycosyltransferase [Anaerolineae bacterium]|nr:glycosyltransferase [Anaerolineae bacterium]
MITYNHAPYIAQAIESVLMQDTDFPVELVIGEDCSTDNTRAIARDYGERYSDRIRLLLPDHNLGMIPNFVTTLKACNGQYIALLEGDDYWTDPRKLQKQVDFLEAHPECNLCFHDVLKLYEDGSRPSSRRSQPENRHIFDLEDVLRSTLSQTASMVFRRNALPEIPGWFYRTSLGDWSLSVLLAEHGSIGYLHELMSVWRVHGGGQWTSIAEHERLRQMLHTYDLFDAHFGYRYAAFLAPLRSMLQYDLALSCWLEGQDEEEMQWTARVRENLPEAAELVRRNAVDSANEIELHYGYEKANDAIDWTCEIVEMQPNGALWCRKLRAEWYASYAYKAHQRGSRIAVLSASLRAVWYDWRIFSNRGFVCRWLSALIGNKAISWLREFGGEVAGEPGLR